MALLSHKRERERGRGLYAVRSGEGARDSRLRTAHNANAEEATKQRCRSIDAPRPAILDGGP
jgi:hypothetical protein